MIYSLYGSSSDDVGKAVGAWLSEQKGRKQHPPYTVIGWAGADMQIFAAVLFNDYNGANIEIHGHGPRGITRARWKEVLTYVFVKLKCKRLTVKGRDGDNLLPLIPRLGFEYEATLRDYFPDADAHVYVMGPEVARKWLYDRHARTSSTYKSGDYGGATATA